MRMNTLRSEALTAMPVSKTAGPDSLPTLRGRSVLQALAGQEWGGGSVVVRSIVKRLVAEGCRVTVLCSPDAQTVAEFAETGAELIHSTYWRRNVSPLNDLRFLFELFNLCHRRQFDIVHTHTSKTGIVGRLAARLAGTPLIIHTIHGFSFHEFSRGVGPCVYLTLEQIAGHFADLLISVNREDKETALARYIIPPERIVTILNGIDPQPLTPIQPAPLREMLGLPPETILIGSVGRLAPQKGYTDLLQAAVFIVTHTPHAHILIVGDGPQRVELESLADALHVSSNCHFLGFRADVSQVLAAFDIYVSTSLWEGLSISLLEALAAGKPIIATDIKGNRETIHDGQNGLLVPPTNPGALAEAIVKLVKDPTQCRRLARRARQSAEIEFSEERMTTEIVDVYRHSLMTKV